MLQTETVSVLGHRLIRRQLLVERVHSNFNNVAAHVMYPSKCNTFDTQTCFSSCEISRSSWQCSQKNQCIQNNNSNEKLEATEFCNYKFLSSNFVIVLTPICLDVFNNLFF